MLTTVHAQQVRTNSDLACLERKEPNFHRVHFVEYKNDPNIIIYFHILCCTMYFLGNNYYVVSTDYIACIL